MGDAVLDEPLTVDGEPLISVPADQIRLSVEHPRAVTVLNHIVDKRPREAVAAGIDSGDDTADPASVPIIEKTNVGPYPSIILDGNVAGTGLLVSAVKLGVRAFLFNDEYVDTQPQNGVELVGRKTAEFPIANLHVGEPSVDRWRQC